MLALYFFFGTCSLLLLSSLVLLLLLLVVMLVFFSVLFSIVWLNFVLNWFVNLSKYWHKLNRVTSFGVGRKDGPFFNKDCWYWLSSIFVRLIAFWFGKLFFISESSFFLQFFLPFFSFAWFLPLDFLVNIDDSLFQFLDYPVLCFTKISSVFFSVTCS